MFKRAKKFENRGAYVNSKNKCAAISGCAVNWFFLQSHIVTVHFKNLQIYIYLELSEVE